MQQHAANKTLSLPLSSSVIPLQPTGTPASPLSRSTNLPGMPLASAPLAESSFEPSLPHVGTSYDHLPQHETEEDSDDVLWESMTEPALDDQYSPSSQSFKPQLTIAAPPSSQPILPGVSAIISAPSTATASATPTSQSSFISGIKYTPDPALTMTPYYPELLRTLRDVFGLQTFRTNQLEAISACMENKDVFVLMPTGGGKSLCFQLPAVVKHRQRKTVTFVVSPLISLMNDQVQALKSKGISVALLKGEQRNNGAVFSDLLDPIRRPCLVYVTPEFLEKSQRLQERLSQLATKDEIALFVIDEAHCIQTWGRSFRESVSVRAYSSCSR